MGKISFKLNLTPTHHPHTPPPSTTPQVFGITFRTPPADSTGVPHILEHSVLCGSRKFPVKVIFFYLFVFVF
jgi:Zn-dependent M16 (insulinase) family peptidase